VLAKKVKKRTGVTLGVVGEQKKTPGFRGGGKGKQTKRMNEKGRKNEEKKKKKPGNSGGKKQKRWDQHRAGTPGKGVKKSLKPKATNKRNHKKNKKAQVQDPIGHGYGGYFRPEKIPKISGKNEKKWKGRGSITPRWPKGSWETGCSQPGLNEATTAKKGRGEVGRHRVEICSPCSVRGKNKNNREKGAFNNCSRGVGKQSGDGGGEGAKKKKKTGKKRRGGKLNTKGLGTKKKERASPGSTCSTKKKAKQKERKPYQGVYLKKTGGGDYTMGIS